MWTGSSGGGASRGKTRGKEIFLPEGFLAPLSGKGCVCRLMPLRLAPSGAVRDLVVTQAR